MNAEQTRAPVPLPPSHRRGALVAGGAAVMGLVLLAFVLTGAWRVVSPSRPATASDGVSAPQLAAAAKVVTAAASAGTVAPPPASTTAASAPAPSAPVASAVGGPAATVAVLPSTGAAGATSRAATARRPARVAQAGRAATASHIPGVLGSTHILAAWEAGFYPVYETAMNTFGVNWLLLASIHKQETAFSTAPSTYHGLNSVGCCGGPMQFNVTNGPVSTWDLVKGAYRYAKRPASYGHETAHHPSIYDDFDSMMAAAWLLSSNGAGMALDGSAWQAAYDYYGHDDFGVTYADQVLARAIGWSQHGFCINCSLDPALVAAVHASYGASALAALDAPPPAAPPKRRHRAHQPRAIIASAKHGAR
jgi:hypothetical protein